jgi:quinol monooxygenase YgiN
MEPASTAHVKRRKEVRAMLSRGLLVRLEAKAGKDADVGMFLRSALPLVQQEPGTTAWFAVRFGRGEYGIFDAFPGDEQRNAHLAGPVAQALQMRGGELFAAAPRIQKLAVLADKLPVTPAQTRDTKGLLLTFKAKSGHEPEVEKFLRDAQALVMSEPKTTAWFAIHLDQDEYGIFDVFPDNGGRFAHLTGRVPRELAKRSLTLLGSMPDMEMLSVEAEKLAA